jgi:hypothetical protein
MAEHDLRQSLEVGDDDRTVATAEVITSEASGGTAWVSLQAESGHITPGRRASLVDAVLDLPEVRESAHLEVVFRRDHPSGRVERAPGWEPSVQQCGKDLGGPARPRTC